MSKDYSPPPAAQSARLSKVEEVVESLLEEVFFLRAVLSSMTARLPKNEVEALLADAQRRYEEDDTDNLDEASPEEN